MMFRRLLRRNRRLLWTSLLIFNLCMVMTVMTSDKHHFIWLSGIIPVIPVDSTFNNATGGYRLAKYLKNQCKREGYNSPIEYVRLNQKYTTSNKGLHLCPIWKVGSTFQKRLFMIETMDQYKNYSNPYDISYTEWYGGNRGLISNTDSSVKFMFVRNPYQRLLSCYVDKLLAPNPVYWEIIGIPAIRQTRKEPSASSLKCGHDLTFGEFIKYVISALQVNKGGGLFGRFRTKVGVMRDQHFELYTVLCKPCTVNYDFVGKMETFKEDSLELVRQMNLTKVARVLKKHGDILGVTDAIRDTIHQPFDRSFSNKFLKCINKREAIERAWKKLQTRGLIGVRDLDLVDTEAEQMTQAEFEKMAFKAREDSTTEERKRVKQKFYYEMYKSVDRSDLERISMIYRDDFILFDYDPRPKDLFARSL